MKIKNDAFRVKSGPASAKEQQWKVRLLARVAPHSTAPSPMQLQIDPHVAPGVYEADFEFDGERRDVILHVLEHRELLLVPNRFDLCGKPGAVLAQPLLISNAGNVAIDLPKAAFAPLTEHGVLHSSLHVALIEKGAEGHQAVLDAYATLLAQAEVEPVKVMLRNSGAKVLTPGESLASEITFELPAGLKKHRLYRGAFLMGRTRCRLEVQSQASVQSKNRSRGAQ